MIENPDVFQIGSFNCYFTIRWYTTGSNWGYRSLGMWRHAFDFGRVSFLFERYF